MVPGVASLFLVFPSNSYLESPLGVPSLVICVISAWSQNEDHVLGSSHLQASQL